MTPEAQGAESPAASPLIWALCDGRAGNDNQTLGVAHACGGRVLPLRIGFNPAVSLAKLGLAPAWTAVDDASRASLKDAPAPDVIIGAGGRLSAAAHYAKTTLAPYALRVQILLPPRITRDTDLLVHPLHDVPRNVPRSVQTLRIAGAPNRIGALLPAASEGGGARLRAFLRVRRGDTLAAIFLGGAVKGVKPPGASEAQHVRACLEKMADKGDADVFVFVVSRRTPKPFTALLQSYFPEAFFLGGKNDDGRFSAVDAYAAADALCVTADSVSMCSEACSSGKPVFLLRFAGCMKRKHVMFSEFLLTDGYAEDMDGYLVRGSAKPRGLSGKILRDTENVAETVLRML